MSAKYLYKFKLNFIRLKVKRRLEALIRKFELLLILGSDLQKNK